MSLTGYGPSNQWQNITFDGDERKFELWETKFLGYMKLRKLKDVLVSEDDEVDEEKNETAFAELIQFLDERSLSLVMRDARDDGRKAFQILRDHYAGSGKPRIITLYTQLTSLKKGPSETTTDFVLRAETAANALKNAKENVSDGLLIAMILKGLPDAYKPFVAVITQSDTIQNFQKFKQVLRNYEETEKSRTEKADKGANVVLKAKVGQSRIICYSCGIAGHKSSECKQKSVNKWCSHCKSSTHTDKVCRKQKDKAKLALSHEDNQHNFAFTIRDKTRFWLWI